MKKIAVLMGSERDMPVMEKAINTLRRFGVEAETHVYSAHRTPEAVREFASRARERGFGAVICGAGKAAHLAGAVAAQTTLPVIGVPLSSAFMGGLDALLSTVQMPAGIPVATVAVDGAENAALLACQILSVSDAELTERLSAHRGELAAKAAEADRALSEKL